MKSNIESRRSFLKKSGILSAGFMGLQSLMASQYFGCTPLQTQGLPSKYGPLVKDPAGKLNLPEGFTYKIIAKKGDTMSDGFVHPGKPDGTI